MRKSSKKGFTLAELLIVIAIIAVLVAIMIPVFGAQLNKAKAASELANVRAAYAEELANAMLAGTDLEGTSDAVVTAEKLEAALSAKNKDDTKITLEIAPDPAAGTKGKITVEYKSISGSFEIDEDVVIKKGGTPLASAGVIWSK